MMKLASLALAAALWLAVAGPAAADPFTFSLVGVTLTTGNTGTGSAAGTLSGTFTTDATLSTVLSANIVASASAGYPGFDYTFGVAGANSTLAESLPTQFFQLTSGSDVVRIYFSNTNDLTANGAAILSGGFSYEQEAGVLRTVSAGSVSPAAVPEPSSLALMGIAGALGLVAARVRRKQA